MKEMKYEIQCGAFVTQLRHRKLIISADNEEDAKEKAIKKMDSFWADDGENVEVGHVFFDSINEINGSSIKKRPIQPTIKEKSVKNNKDNIPPDVFADILREIGLVDSNTKIYGLDDK